MKDTAERLPVLATRYKMDSQAKVIDHLVAGAPDTLQPKKLNGCAPRGR